LLYLRLNRHFHLESEHCVCCKQADYKFDHFYRSVVGPSSYSWNTDIRFPDSASRWWFVYHLNLDEAFHQLSVRGFGIL